MGISTASEWEKVFLIFINLLLCLPNFIETTPHVFFFVVVKFNTRWVQSSVEKKLSLRFINIEIGTSPLLI